MCQFAFYFSIEILYNYSNSYVRKIVNTNAQSVSFDIVALNVIKYIKTVVRHGSSLYFSNQKICTVDNYSENSQKKGQAEEKAKCSACRVERGRGFFK